MDDELPSYEHAVNRDCWGLVAPYIRSRDLCAAVLVCNKWNTILQPHLWGSPASHFGVSDDDAYIALTTFKRTLSWARPSTRAMTHTLHLPPAHAEMYGGPHSDWLRDVLERLPRLQALIVHKVPFFDHSALHTTRTPSPLVQGFYRQVLPSYSLRLLDASSTPNATSTGLVTALSHLTSLVFLDLSNTTAARDLKVLESLRKLSGLKVLKLRKLGLRDDDIVILAQAIKGKVASLDLGKNQITDIGMDTLIRECLPEVGNLGMPLLFPPHTQPRWHPQCDISLGEQVTRTLVASTVGPLVIEGDTINGISELYVSRNRLTTSSVTKLLGRDLRFLDVGTVATSSALTNSVQALSLADFMERDQPRFHSVIHEMNSGHCRWLRYIRINHAIITEDIAERNRLEPTHILKVHELVLTDVPKNSMDRGISERLIRFIKECAAQTKRVQLEARVSYALPPGRNRLVAEREYARSQFALRRIVLEIEASTTAVSIRAGTGSSWRQHDTGRSSTEDPDSDALWSAAENDFSFFGEDEQGKSTVSPSQTHVASIRPDHVGQSLFAGHPKFAIDTVAELSKFRSERKAAFNKAVQQRGPFVHVEGYWPGDITVIRGPDAESDEQRFNFYGR